MHEPIRNTTIKRAYIHQNIISVVSPRLRNAQGHCSRLFQSKPISDALITTIYVACAPCDTFSITGARRTIAKLIKSCKGYKSINTGAAAVVMSR